MKIGDTVFPNFGVFEGEPVKILKIEFGAGAKNGWYTCLAENGDKLLYAGEEIRMV